MSYVGKEVLFHAKLPLQTANFLCQNITVNLNHYSLLTVLNNQTGAK